MKKIKINKWTSKDQEGKDMEDSTKNIITYAIQTGMNEEKLVGFDNMRKLNRIGIAMDRIKNDILELDDEDFEMIKKFIDKYSPAIWGTNPFIMKAVSDFMDKEDEEK